MRVLRIRYYPYLFFLNNFRQLAYLSLITNKNDLFYGMQVCLSQVQRRKKPGVPLYESGHNRFSIYKIFLEWEGRYCPCCGYMLRTKQKEGKSQQKMPRIVCQEDLT